MTESNSRHDSPPPNAVLHHLGVGHWISQALYVVAKLGIADVLAGGPKGIEPLASEVGANASALYRVMRALASVGVFSEIASRQFALNPISNLLRSDVPGSMRALAMLTELEWKPWEHMLHSVRTGETAAEHLYGMNFFVHLQRHPEKLAIFNSAMTSFVAQNAIAVCEAYDFAKFGYGTVVDVGGGHGLLMASILERSPSTKGIVFDLPSVVERAPQTLKERGVIDRAQCVGGSFFDGVPKGGDAYVLSSILHDWDDERATSILRQCRRVIPPAGVLLLVEMVIPQGDAPFVGKLLDLEMLVMFGGRERTEEEYATLLRGADFELARIIPTAGPASVIEAHPRN
jgi:hypothetical protein